MIFQISYDLKGPAADYASLYEKLKNLGQYKPILQSTWLVSGSDLTAESITDALSPLIKPGDRFFVSSIEVGRYNGWHSRETWDWIRSRTAS